MAIIKGKAPKTPPPSDSPRQLVIKLRKGRGRQGLLSAQRMVEGFRLKAQPRPLLPEMIACRPVRSRFWLPT